MRARHSDKTTRRVLPATLAALGLAFGLTTGTPVMAADSLLVCEPGQPFLWPDGGENIPFNPDQGDLFSGVIDNATGTTLVQQSFDNWTAAGPFSVPTSATYVNAGPLPVDVDITNFAPFLEPVAPDGLSAIVFDATGEIFELLFGPGSGILGFAGPEWVLPDDCSILEGSAFLNGPAFDDLTEAEDIMTHEFGHYSNLGHVELNGQLLAFGEGGDDTGPSPDNDTFPPPPTLAGLVETMYPLYFGPEAGTLSPHADDVASLATLYPGPDFAADTASVSGAVFAPDGTTRLSGVNVIARNLADPFADAVSTFSGAYTDGTDQADPNVGTFTLSNLTPGADYALFVDEVTAQAGRFSNPILVSLPGPEEFWNDSESDLNPPDDPTDFTPINLAAGEAAGGFDIVFNNPSPGEPLPVGEDGSYELTLPFQFEVCGTKYRSVFVNANGNLTFGAPDSTFLESSGVFLAGPPRIAGLFTDLSPFNLFTGEQQGLVTFEERKNRFTVVFEDVPEFPDTGSNSFEIELKKGSNQVQIHYGGLTAPGGIAGISCGGAITSGFEAGEDLSEVRGRINMKRNPARYEQFDGNNPLDLANERLRFNGTSDFNDRWAENNDSPDKARNINVPFSSEPIPRFTEIEPAGDDIDWFTFRTPQGVDGLLIDIIGGQLDSYIALFDDEGNLVAVDDDGGSGLLSSIFVPEASGRYFLAITTFPDSELTGAGGSGGRYVLTIEGFDGTILPLVDEGSVEVDLPFSFPFQGASYDSVWVNDNGFLMFGTEPAAFTFLESTADFLAGPPRIAVLWDDLDTSSGGRVVATEDGDAVTFSWEGVPQFFTGDSNTFSVTLNADGSYSTEYGALGVSDGLVGTTEGGGAADPGESDVSAGGPFPAAGTTYELFDGFDNDLQGSTVDFD